MTNYVSAVPLKELGLGLGIEHLGDEQAQELTDDYSLPALKVKPKGQRQLIKFSLRLQFWLPLIIKTQKSGKAQFFFPLKMSVSFSKIQKIFDF